MYLALALALLVLFTRLLNSVPTAQISERLWTVWMNHVPTPAVRAFRQKRGELHAVRQARADTSSQDEFAKWARLDRQHQNTKREYEELQRGVAANRRSFNRGVRIAKWVATSGVRWYVQWHYRKTPVAWIPREAVPRPVEYFLALPSAPYGSISLSTWLFAADTTANMAIKFAKRLYARQE